MSMFKKSFLFLLLALSIPSHAQRQDVQCSADNRYYDVGYCPGYLTAPSTQNVGPTTAQITMTLAEQSAGVLHSCLFSATQSPEPTPAQIIACSGGQATAKATSSPSAEGGQTVSAVGLSPSTTYFPYSVHQFGYWTGNVVSASSFTTGVIGGGGGDGIVIPQTYYVVENRSKMLSFAATSPDIEFVSLSGPTPNYHRRYRAHRTDPNGETAFSTWTLLSAPSNGTLYDNAGVQLNSLSQFTDPFGLTYVPDTDYTGTDSISISATDSSGESPSANISLIVSDPASYPMPLGVPDPGFGIASEPPADPGAWPSAEATGFYYIDKDDPSCTDANTYGYPDVPRCDLPGGPVVPAGGKLVLAASVDPYYIRDNSWARFELNGTDMGANSAWMVGINDGPIKPIISAPPGRTNPVMRLEGANYFIDGIDFNDVTLDHRGDVTGNSNAVLRHSRVHDKQGGSGSCINLSFGSNQSVIFDVAVYNCGIVTTDLDDERDVHGFFVNDGVLSNIMDSISSQNAGDTFQQNGGGSNVSFARNKCSGDMENCVDIKTHNNLLVVDNMGWDYRNISYTGGSGGNAQIFYINDEGTQQGYKAFINNIAFDTTGIGIGTANIGDGYYAIGNQVFFMPQATGLSGAGGGATRYWYFNTVDNANVAMGFFTTGGAADRYSAGNVTRNAGTAAVRITSSHADHNGHDYNFHLGANPVFQWGANSSPTSGNLAAFQAATGKGTNDQINVSANFVDPDNYNYTQQAPSDLIDAIPAGQINTIMPELNNLMTTLGITLTDILGTQRPVNTNYDAGSVEAQ